MGYNIEEMSGTFTGTTAGGADGWVGNFQMGDPNVTTITGDFGDPNGGEAAGGYTFSALSTTQFGTLSSNPVNGQFTFTVNKAAVIAAGADQTVTFTVVGSDGGFTDTDDVTINILICFAGGTMIRTPTGDVLVEDIVAGDHVETRDRGPRQVIWTGRRNVTQAELAANPDLLPIRIGAGALGDGLPRTDLLVSPQHRVLVTGWRAELLFGEDEVLVPAKSLLNDTTILRAADVDSVSYHHILFDQHEIIWSNGAPSESFFPGKWTMDEISAATRAELVRLFPQIDEPQGIGDAAAPTMSVTEGRVLAPTFLPTSKRRQ